MIFHVVRSVFVQVALYVNDSQSHSNRTINRDLFLCQHQPVLVCTGRTLVYSTYSTGTGLYGRRQRFLESRSYVTFMNGS